MTSRLSNPIGRATLTAAYQHLGLQTLPDEDEPWWHNAVSWRFQLELIQSAKRCFPGRIVDLRFEDLCDQPQLCADRLSMMLGIPPKSVGLPVQFARFSRWETGDMHIGPIWELCGERARDYGYSRCLSS